MTRRILKFSLDPASGGTYTIPEPARLLALQVQRGVPVMWWSGPSRSGDDPQRSFVVVPTGMPADLARLHYVGTYQLGDFVGHVYTDRPFEREARKAVLVP